ncbi:MAG TPA: hypothetical protein VL994_12290 [Steroidobacteraceae bacterium]|nr:hypothetical protein [Steroidobacteraceae bacterium]
MQEISRRRFPHALLGAILAVALGSVAAVALADPAPAAGDCPVSVPEQAKWLANEFFAQGAYQRAGECYQVAGEYARANEAFVRAVGPRSEATARQMSEQRERARALFHQVQVAFHGAH